MWEIQDNNGTIHSGTESEMETAFTLMTNPISELEEIFGKSNDDHCLEFDKDIYDFEWDGDLKLVQIHNIYK